MTWLLCWHCFTSSPVRWRFPRSAANFRHHLAVYEIVVPWSANVCSLSIYVQFKWCVWFCATNGWHCVYIWLILLHLPSFHLCLHLRPFDIHAPRCARNRTPNGESRMNRMSECWRGRKLQLFCYHCVLAAPTWHCKGIFAVCVL